MACLRQRYDCLAAAAHHRPVQRRGTHLISCRARQAK
jgi:hypothetical protein